LTTARSDSPIPIRRPSSAAADAPLVASSGGDADSPLRWLAIGLAPLVLVYLLLFNPYWVPGGDSELYVCIARSLLKGEGYAFNGGPVAMVPPGWPLLLAGVLSVSTSFAAVKAVMIASMLGSLAATFFVLLRFVTPRTAALVIGLSGILFPVYPLTYWTHSEAVFCLLASTSLLLAFRINEGKHGWPSVAALALLCAAAVTVRWTGLIHLSLIAGALLGNGRLRLGTHRRPSLALAITLLVTGGTFFGTYKALELTSEQTTAAKAAGAAMDSGADAGDADAGTAAIGSEAKALGAGDIVTPKGKNGIVEEYFERFIRAGKWFSWLLWHETRFGQSVKLVDAAAMLFGWVVIGLLACALLAGLQRKQFFWLALAAYTGALCMNWPNPNSRYFVPVAPFVVAGVLLGLKAVAGWFPARPVAVRGTKWAAGAFVASLLFCNGVLLAVDVWVMRSGDRFYHVYEGGQHEELIRLVQQVKQIKGSFPLTDDEILISERYVNLGRNRFSKAAVRAVVLLTDREVRAVPGKFAKEPIGAFRAWTRAKVNKRAPFYLYQKPWSPWRLWHFRLTAELQHKLTGKPVEERSGGWVLYRFRAGNWRPVEDAPPPIVPPSHVPFYPRDPRAPTTEEAPDDPSATQPSTEPTTDPASTQPADDADAPAARPSPRAGRPTTSPAVTAGPVTRPN
jgi:hypothetical protein